MHHSPRPQGYTTTQLPQGVEGKMFMMLMLQLNPDGFVVHVIVVRMTECVCVSLSGSGCTGVNDISTT